MTETTYTPPTPRPGFGRTKGAKLLIVCILAVLMSVPAGFVFLLLHDRTTRAAEVATEIGGLMGGEQTFLGPVIMVPYVIPAKITTDAAGQKSSTTQQNGELIVFPLTGKADAVSKSEVRSRSLFRIPVYTSDLNFNAHFDLSQVALPAPDAVLQWDRAQLLSGASDSRGARNDIAAIINSKAATLSPSPLGQQTLDGSTIDLFGTPLTGVDPSKPFDVSLAMTFTGAQKLGVLAFAKSTDVTLAGDWDTPSFGGGFLPATRAFHHDQNTPLVKGEEELKSGFKATWSIPFIARGMPAVVNLSNLSALGKSELSVTFVEPGNPYQAVARSLKYALLFVGLVFLTYFVFESTTRRELHPAQYVLVGLAQITFYLLLLSFAERIGFDAAFATAAAATVLLISAYAGMVFKSIGRFIAALVVFSLLYGLIYVLMRMEDYALLIGAVSAFAVITVVMVLTRNINWYGGKESDPA